MLSKILKSKGFINICVLAVAILILLPAAISTETTHEHVKQVYLELPEKEGVGDTLTNVPTGEMGVTDFARQAVGGSDLSDPLVALEFLIYLDKRWHRVVGYSSAPKELKMALLDSSYNLGEQIFNYRSLIFALSIGDYLGVVYELLDTANVENQSVKGLAIRRAQAYNKVAQKDIMFVKQTERGEVVYATVDEIIFRYIPEGGRHEKSNPGSVLINHDPSGMF